MDALEAIGLQPDGKQLALNSFENRVYQIGLESSLPVIVKFYRPHRWSDEAILEEHAFTQTLMDAELPVTPPQNIGGATLHHHNGFSYAVFSKQKGRAPELGNAGTLAWMGRFIGRIHVIGRQQDYRHRPALTPQLFGNESVDWLLANQALPPELEKSWESTVQSALKSVAYCYERAGLLESLRLHGDCHMGNVLWTEDGPHFVDFDDSRSGPAVQDLWMLLSGNRDEMQTQLDQVLTGYRMFSDFNPKELQILEALRTLRLINFSAWIAKRWNDPAFPAAFPWFASHRFWQDRILELREQIALMDEPPLTAN